MEGVDIPGVNMVLFLRPTESSTIFIQQLGRGLRKYDNKQYVTVLDFIGNSYKRSVQIAFALSSLAENFVLEKRLMMSLVRDDFKAIGLDDYGVEIHIDDLSKEEIISCIERENFNSLGYLKQDYFNFRKYIGAESYPRHMDYLNNDCAPDLLRFMSIKIGGKKCVSYYNFLHGILDDSDDDAKLLPVFTERQIAFAAYLSAMLPLVRQHEYLIFDSVIHGIIRMSEIEKHLSETVAGYSHEQMEHALKYIRENGFLSSDGESCALTDVPLDDQFIEYLEDLLEYGLTRFTADYGEEAGFKLWQSYRMDQVQLKLLKNPGYNQVGTYYYGKTVVIFASLKKDASVTERLNYKDRFIEPDMFQWESMANVSASDLQKLNESEETLLFIRKVSEENGIVMPFTYVGKGQLTNPRRQVSFDEQKQKEVVTYLFDIPMENELPEYLRYDFGLTK